MKSPEHMGGPPEQPKEEPVKDKEEAPAKPASPESYNEAEWEKLKWEKLRQGGAVFAINKGKEMGVPKEELDRFAEDIIARETENHHYGLVYSFRKDMGIGTAEEVRAVGEQAYKFFLEGGSFGSAMNIAEDVYGRDSEEWRRANEANEAERKKAEEKRTGGEEMEDEERELNAIISKDATFVDLFNAIDAIEEEEGLGELHFEDELWDNFDATIMDEVLAFRDEASKAATTKVLDFFQERGYSQSDVSIFLPIKFK